LSTRLRTASPLAHVGQGLGLPRSTLYSQAHLRDDPEGRQAIAAVAQPFPPSGRRRVAAQLRRAPPRLLVHRQRAPRVMRHLGLLRRIRPRKPHTTKSRHAFRRLPNPVAERVASEPDERWGCDLTDGRLGPEFIDLALIMAVLTRDLRGWQLARTVGQALPLTALPRALAHRTPVIHHSEQGIQ
jgi:putative transposase